MSSLTLRENDHVHGGEPSEPAGDECQLELFWLEAGRPGFMYSKSRKVTRRTDGFDDVQLLCTVCGSSAVLFLGFFFIAQLTTVDGARTRCDSTRSQPYS